MNQKPRRAVIVRGWRVEEQASMNKDSIFFNWLGETFVEEIFLQPDRARVCISEGNSSRSREVKRSKAARPNNSESKLETRLVTTFVPTANQRNDV